MINNFLNRKNNFFTGLLIIIFVFSFNVNTVFGQDAPRAIPVNDEGIPIALPVEDPTARGGATAVFDVSSLGGAASSCAAGFVGNELTSSLAGFAERLMGSITGEVPTSDSQIRVKETRLDGIAFCLVNGIIESILAGTIQWVESGFDGNPAFVENPEQFFTDVADYELGQVLDAFSGGRLCSPWDADIRLAVLGDYFGYNSLNGGFRCSLTDIVENVDQFVSGDFEQGGWTGWFELTQKAHNNPYGSYREVENVLYTRIQERQGIVQTELNWSGGFFSIIDKNTKEIESPGILIKESIADKLNIPAERITAADEFDELISQLVNQFISIAFDQFGGGGF